GNGWLANKISYLENTYIIGVDVNEFELEQATRVFGKKKNLLFAYTNIFEPALSEIKFDIIILAAVIQYFPDSTQLLDNLILILTDGGELHILDSPLYNAKNIDKAKENTLQYYNQNGFPEMAKFYHHHLFSILKNYKKTILYNPHNIIKKSIRYFIRKDESPFYWIKITK
ncbi:MAG: class I SAM-dependent methyltransferase, partial [Ignavibacteria bacterium]